MQSNTNRSANAGETGRLEGSCKLIFFSVYHLAYAFFKCVKRQGQISNLVVNRAKDRHSHEMSARRSRMAPLAHIPKNPDRRGLHIMGMFFPRMWLKGLCSWKILVLQTNIL